MQRFDKYWIGILLGLLLPALIAYIYLRQNNLFWLFDEWEMAKHILTKLCIISVFPNMALLFVFYTMETWRLAKGIILGAIPYVLLAIGLTF